MAETSKETPFGRDNYSASLIANKIQWSVEGGLSSRSMFGSIAGFLKLSEKYTLRIHEVCPIPVIQDHKNHSFYTSNVLIENELFHSTQAKAASNAT